MSECKPIKIGEENESEFNKLIYIIVKKIAPIFNKEGITANGVTTLSLIFCILTYVNLRQKNKTCIIYYFIYIVLDYTDGYMARKYNTMSKIGDIYDHSRDVIFHIFILYAIISDKKLVVLYILGIILSMNSFACQEIIHESTCKEVHNGTIAWLKPMCTNNNKIIKIYNKYIGSGSSFLMTMIVMFMYCSSNEHSIGGAYR